MKNHIDTYGLYRVGKRIRYTVRIKVTMKEDVDIDILRVSVNKAINRYPYFRVKIILDDDGGYNLIPNNKDIVVIETRDNLPKLGSEEVNNHLLYIDTKGKEIYINICHSLAGGKGFSPFIETLLYQYVTDRHKVNIDAPNIRKSDSELLEGENIQFDPKDFENDHPFKLKNRSGYVLLLEYLKGLLNTSNKNKQYYVLSFDQKDIMKYAKSNDSSVAAAFIVFIFKSLCKVLPKFAKKIVADIAHNPTSDYGYPNSHSDLLSHILVSFKRDMKNWDNEKLGTITRSQIFLQSDPDFTSIQLSNKFKAFEKLDKIKTNFGKRAFALFNCSNLTEPATGATFIVNYTGKREWGELANYVESFVFIVDGHLMSEITSMNDKFFLCFLQLNKKPKYIESIKSTFNELNIPFTIKGPYTTDHVLVEKPR